MTLVHAAQCLPKTLDRASQFVVFISDNQCAVAMASRLHSRAPQIKQVAAQLREHLKAAGAQSTGFHLPGVLNVHTDRPSRAGEALYAEMQPHRRLTQWAQTLACRVGTSTSDRVLGVTSLPAEPAEGVLYVVVPAPHLREACINQAISWRVYAGLVPVVLVLPDADYSDNRWSPIVKRLKRIALIPWKVPLFQESRRAHHPLWNNSLFVDSAQVGTWHMWMVA
jgi:hypothetical protein